MSEENPNQPNPPPTPQAKTSAVPLKKETVRITLRARPGAGVTQAKEHTTPIASHGTTPVPRPITTSVTPAGAASSRVPTSPVGTVGAPASKSTAPIQLPSAPLPPPAARISTTQVALPTAPAPTPQPVARPALAPAPSAPPRPGGAPSAPGAPGAPVMAPTVRLAKAPGPPRPPMPAAPGTGAKVEAGATTSPLAKAPGGPRPPGTISTPMGKPVGPTQQLPKATVQLSKNTTPLSKQQPMVTPPSAPVKRASEQDTHFEEKDPEAGLAPLAVLCMVLALALMAVNLLGSDKAFFAEKGQESSFMVPAPEDPTWEKLNQQDGTHTSSFTSELAKYKSKYE